MKRSYRVLPSCFFVVVVCVCVCVSGLGLVVFFFLCSFFVT